MPCIEKSGALPSVPRRRWPTLTASCGQVQFSDLCAQGRSVAASLRYRLRRAGKDIIMDGWAAGNVVLVHCGFVDGSGWQGFYSILKKDGYNVRAESMCSM